MSRGERSENFYGWRVVHAAFVLGLFGWGLGFYGPPVFLRVIHDTHGWSLWADLRDLTLPAAGNAPAFFAASALVQCLAVVAFLAGRRR